MARHNGVSLLGSVIKVTTQKDLKTGADATAFAFINIIRGTRAVGDYRKTVAAYKAPIFTSDPAIIAKMVNWKEHDIVMLKGTFGTKKVIKGSFCSECGAKNSNDGILSYVSPIFVNTVKHLDTDDEVMAYLIENQEIGNIAYIIGSLVRNPKLFVNDFGLKITQYQIAINRKYRVPGDGVETKADFPWVKSYGQNAEEDALRLRISSEVFIDGYLQARSVNRHAVCKCCGAKYDWKDNAMEIVPYTTEYLTNYLSDEEIAERQVKEAEEAREQIIKSTIAGAVYEPGKMTDEDREEGYSDD